MPPTTPNSPPDNSSLGQVQNLIEKLGIPMFLVLLMGWIFYQAGSVLVAAHVDHLKEVSTHIKISTETQKQNADTQRQQAEILGKLQSAFERIEARLAVKGNQ